MGMAEPSRDLEERVTRVEDAVQEFRFVHMTKTDAQTAGMGILYAGQQRIEHTLTGFRAEVAAEFGSFRSEVNARFGAVRAELDAVKAEQARQGGLLEEILRRLPEPGREP